MTERSEIIAALGPTNTGKTFRALQRMREHETGMIGLPLRLLAREVYDTLIRDVGESEVALITGEEKLIPRSPRYFVCTVEAMPIDRDVDFLAVDEIQLAGHHERGHIFTHRLLYARGLKETWFIGSESMEPLVRRLVPTAKFTRQARLSRLRCEGSYTLTSLPRRSAIVAFSVPRVYELAERVRVKRGGVAIVLGALSPRARNAQVAMYQDGEVDYLVATDAIGLGLNLDIERVAFADTRKFDGLRERALSVGELAQIAGRAGRYHADGAFGTLAPRPPLPEEIARAIEEHRIGPESAIYYRNHSLDFTSPQALLSTLWQTPHLSGLHLPSEASDAKVLSAHLQNEKLLGRVKREDQLRLLWEICQIPDYRKLLLEEHVRLTGEIYLELSEHGVLRDDFLRQKVLRLREHSGDIDAIVGRIASVRTWAYVSCQPAWVSHSDWQAQTRELEDGLSDQLHAALVERFVTKRVRPRPVLPKKKDRSLASQLSSLQAEFGAAEGAPEESAFDRLCSAKPLDFDFSPHGTLDLRGVRVASLSRGKKLLEPQVRVHLETIEDEPGARRLAEAHLREVVSARILSLGAHLSLERDDLAESENTLLRGIGYQLREGLGSLRLRQVQGMVRALRASGRAALDTSRVTVGRRHIYVEDNLSRDAVLARLALVSTYKGVPALGSFKPAEVLLIDRDSGLTRFSAADFETFGYELFGQRAVRVDVVERVLAPTFAQKKQNALPALMHTFRCSEDEARVISKQLGLGGSPRRTRGESAESARGGKSGGKGSGAKSSGAKSGAGGDARGSRAGKSRRGRR